MKNEYRNVSIGLKFVLTPSWIFRHVMVSKKLASETCFSCKFDCWVVFGCLFNELVDDVFVGVQ